MAIRLKVLFKFFFALVVIPGSLAALLFHLNRNGFFDLDHIDIVLIDAPTKSLHLKPLVTELDQALEAYRGQSLWSLKMENISAKIDKLNWVQGHSLSRSWPSTLTIKLKPYEVKALYLESHTQNQFIPVIQEGKLLSSVDASYVPDVAILEGQAFQQSASLRQKAVAMLDEIPNEGSFSKKMISEIRWDTKEGFIAKMIRSGVDVKLGEDRFAIKAARVGQVLEYLDNRGIIAKSLDANLSKKVLVKLQDPTKSSLIE